MKPNKKKTNKENQGVLKLPSFTINHPGSKNDAYDWSYSRNKTCDDDDMFRKSDQTPTKKMKAYL